MRGVLLAGGTGSRMEPLTRAVNKHLLPVGGEPMLFHGLRHMASLGLEDVMIVTGSYDVGALALAVGDGSEFGLEISMRAQARPGGIAQALSLARKFSGNDALLVMLGDNIFAGDLTSFIQGFETDSATEDARVLLKQVDDPRRYGVAEVREGRVVSIEEKPDEPRSALAVIGAYLYRPDVFDVVQTLRPSTRGELEVSDINETYMRRGRLGHREFSGPWIDAGTLASYAKANAMLAPVTLGHSAPLKVVA